MKELKSGVNVRRIGPGTTRRRYYRLYRLLLLLFVAAGPMGRAYGDAALFVEEPYGFFGSINPTGHSAIYLNHVCADTPTSLRRCEAGETGVVISRYSRIGTLDWIAIPLIPYLYAVERAEDVPAKTDMVTVDKIRQEYAERHLESLNSEIKEADRKKIWGELLGAAYIRKIYSFEISTTDEQDDRLIAEYNGRANAGHFNLFTNNCADFSGRLINFYYPHAVAKSITADVAITTPKQIAKALSSYAHHHEDLDLREIIIAQVPGSIHRSHTPRGVVESLLKTKKYALTIAVLEPYFLAGVAVTYLTTGRFHLSNHAPVVAVMDQERVLTNEKPPPMDQPALFYQTTTKAALPPADSPVQAQAGGRDVAGAE